MIDISLYPEAFNEKTMGYGDCFVNLTNFDDENFSIYVAIIKSIMLKLGISSIRMDTGDVIDMHDMKTLVRNKRLIHGYDDFCLLGAVKLFYSSCERKTFWKSDFFRDEHSVNALASIYNTCGNYFNDNCGKLELEVEEARAEFECDFLSGAITAFNDYILGTTQEIDYNSLNSEYPLIDWHFGDDYIAEELGIVRRSFEKFFNDSDVGGEIVMQGALYYMFLNSFDIWNTFCEAVVVKYSNPAIHKWKEYINSHNVDNGELEFRMNYLMKFYTDEMIDGKFFCGDNCEIVETGRLNLQFYLKEVDEVIEKLTRKYKDFTPEYGGFDTFCDKMEVCDV